MTTSATPISSPLAQRHDTNLWSNGFSKSIANAFLAHPENSPPAQSTATTRCARSLRLRPPRRIQFVWQRYRQAPRHPRLRLWPPADFVYKADTNDTREAPAITTCRDLLEEGAQLAIYDPKVDVEQISQDLGVAPTPGVGPLCGDGVWQLALDVIVIPTDHLRHTRFAQEWMAEGEAVVTLRQLNRRCGTLSEATTARIQALPLERS